MQWIGHRRRRVEFVGPRPDQGARRSLVTDYHPNDVVTKPLAELIEDFATHRQAMGVASDYVADIRRQRGRLAAANPGRSLTQLRTAEIDRWLGGLSRVGTCSR